MEPQLQGLPGQMVLVSQLYPPSSNNEARENGPKTYRGHLELRQNQVHQRHSGGPKQLLQSIGSKGEKL